MADTEANQPAPNGAKPGIDEESAALPSMLLRMPVDIRSVALTFITVVLAIWVLYVGRSLFVPILFGAGLAAVLSPAVSRLERWGVPRAAGAAMLLLILFGLAGAVGYRVAGQAVALSEELPDAARRLNQLFNQTTTKETGTLARVQEAADELSKEAPEPRAAGTRAATPVRIVTPPPRIGDYLRSGVLGVGTSIAQVMLVCFLVFFILASGDLFKLKLVKLTGPSLSKKKVTVQIVDEIGATVSAYLRTIALVCSVVGVATWLAFLALEMPNAALWGVLAAVANTVPYVGPTVVWVSASIVAYLHFETVPMALATGGSSLLITGLEGMLLTPLLMSRTAKMNTVAMFVGLLFWGWLWGFWGMLLAVPILMTFKVIADRIEGLAPAGELLGE